MIVYLIKFTLSSVILWGFYRFFLSSEKSFTFNRYYLMFALLFSMSMPFLEFNLPIFQELEVTPVSIDWQLGMEKDAEPMAVESDEPAEVENTFPISILVYAVYSIALVVLLFRFISNLIRLILTIKNNQQVDYHSCKIILLQNRSLPYSFFQYMFFNKDDYESGKIDPIILKHEEAHCRQWHSLDILLVELAQIFFWFNPTILLYKKAIKLNHEYLADQQVLQSGEDTGSYQQVLLKFISNNPASPLACNFNFSSTKKRFLMMIKKNNSVSAVVKKFLIIPLLSLIIFFSCSQPDSSSSESNQLYTSSTEIGENEIDMEKVQMIEFNKTHKSELLDMFGQPTSIEINPYEETWSYKSPSSDLLIIISRGNDIVKHFQYRLNRN